MDNLDEATLQKLNKVIFQLRVVNILSEITNQQAYPQSTRTRRTTFFRLRCRY